MIDLSVQIRITSIRSRGKGGGVIFSGVSEDGNQYVAVCDYKLLPDTSVVAKGQCWKIRGFSKIYETVGANGFCHRETQIAATEAELVRPLGRNIVGWIADSPECHGIGQVKASKLYNRFGSTLIDLIERSDLDALTEVLNEGAAAQLCNAFSMFRVANILLWLDQVGLPRRIGRKVIDAYKDKAQEKIEANPYILISFEADWRMVDEFAIKRLSLVSDDPRRLEAAIEEALYRGMKQGHTCLPQKDVQSRLLKLLGDSNLAERALNQSATPTACQSLQYRVVDGLYQATGMHVIESYVAQRLRQLIGAANAEGQSSLFLPRATSVRELNAVVDTYEVEHKLRLSKEQRDAIRACVEFNLSLILGGAGTGKTTVLKAIYRTLEALHPGIAIFQMALAGRAAQRMTQATGREAFTIARFMATIHPSQISLGTVIVIDEMSMVDVILMYRLLRHLPEGIQLILVGDPNQLPPIGPGLVLHALAGLPTIPQTELKVVQRQTSASGIPQVASAIRDHQVPVWATYLGKPDVGVSFIPCVAAQIESKVQQVYEELRGNGSDYSVQILSITKSNLGGVNSLNTALHHRYRQLDEPVFCLDAEFGIVSAKTIERVALKVGDFVICTENDYDLDLRNGSLGKIIAALHAEKMDDPCCICYFEGLEYRLNSQQIKSLNHAYSITVHKSQGSQFKRIILPIRASNFIDQALIYTAVTRGIEQVVLIGDENACLTAIKAPASAAKRYVTLPIFLIKNL